MTFARGRDVAFRRFPTSRADLPADLSIERRRAHPIRVGEPFKMVAPGDRIVVSESRRLTFVKTRAETDGELLEVRARYGPESPKPPAHYHPNQ